MADIVSHDVGCASHLSSKRPESRHKVEVAIGEVSLNHSGGAMVFSSVSLPILRTATVVTGRRDTNTNRVSTIT